MRLVIALACLLVLAVSAEAGPICRFVQNHRPGIIVPKQSRTCPCPNVPGGGGEPAPAPIVDPGLDVSPYPQSRPAPGTHYYLPISPPSAGGCPGGRCPLPVR